MLDCLLRFQASPPFLGQLSTIPNVFSGRSVSRRGLLVVGTASSWGRTGGAGCERGTDGVSLTRGEGFGVGVAAPLLSLPSLLFVFLRLVFFFEYDDSKTPFLESIFFLLFLSNRLTSKLVGSKLKVESSLWSTRSFLRSCNGEQINGISL